MNPFKGFGHWLFLAIFLLLGAVFIYFLNENFEQNEREALQLKLINEHNRSIDTFTNSVDKFAGLVSGMRSFMNLSPELPTAPEFQRFVKNQFNDINLQDSFVISFIDTSHIFRQSFTQDVINPANLVGTSVGSLRSEKKVARLTSLMKQDSLRVFSPINLVEGWVGLPINFRVHREGRTVGYVAPLLDFKSIVQEIYNDQEADQFVFHFSTHEGHDFDRERIYDGTKVYNNNVDGQYHKNFDVNPASFLYTTVSYYGFDIRIGTALKDDGMTDTSFSRVLLFWYLTFTVFGFIVVWQVHRFRKLNSRLVKINAKMKRRRLEIGDKNRELRQLTTTQKKFFSIIGHDVKQPLNAIQGLLHLLQEEEVYDPELQSIINHLTKSTGTTVSLLDNLLRWAMSQTGDLKFMPSKVEINKLLLEVSDTLGHQASEKHLELIHQLSEGISYRGDKDMLSTIFRNLLANAIKFSNPGGKIYIQSKITKDAVTIKVRDNGIGMTEEEVNSLFQLDKQISTVGTFGETGTGLGLILCYDFAKKHRGHISVESELHKGTEFTLVLPL